MAGGASSSSVGYGWKYDVFLSFRGIDTRHGFTGYLYNALVKRKIQTFIDDEELQRGDEITPSLVKAIQQSRIAVTVLSNNYASSAYCLDELACILHCMNKNGRVLPVFYEVDPSDLRHHKGTYGEALAKHAKRFKADKHKFKDNMERMEKWRKALHQVANLDGYEYQLVGKIVQEISSKINDATLHVIDHKLVGLESRVLNVNLLLDLESDDQVHMVGIYGTSGIGKTTVTRAVCNLIACQFEGSCFLENVRENSNKHGVIYLQQILLFEIVGEMTFMSKTVKQGISTIQHRLQRKKVLVILDDVDELEQLQAIVAGPNWFGSGSRVIITSRERHLLASHGVERTYEVHGLNNSEAVELLNWKAFKTDKVDPGYLDILNHVVPFASGLPLALELIGSDLSGESIEGWKSAFDTYTRRIPNKDTRTMLILIFEALEEYQKKLLVDIACCFKG